MAIYLILLLGICCFGMKFSSFHKDYMSLSSTTAIKGVFAILILLSHTMKCIHLGPGLLDRAFGFTMRYLGQLMVAAFFFYSGYGIAESAKVKEGYVHGFFKKRILKTLFHFDLAVLLFLILQIVLGNHFNPENYIFCWIGWLDIGNSSWFIFAILVLYAISYVALLLKDRFPHPDVFLACLVSLLTVVFWLFVYFQKSPEHWWYDTLAVFPAGIWFSIIKGKVDTLSNKSRIVIALFLIGVFFFWRHFIGIDDYGACAILFMLALTAATFFFKIDNPVLQWFGKHCFSIYMLQRIPMIVFDHLGYQNDKFIFTTSVIVVTIALAWAFTRATDALDTRLFAQ